MVYLIHLYSNVSKFVPLMKIFIMRQFTCKKFLSVTDILMILLIVVLKRFSINFILPRKFTKPQTVEKNNC